MDCGFGHRGFVDFYAMLAIPIAFAINKLFTHRNILIKTFLMAVFVFLCYLNIRLSMMYKWDPCWNGNTWTWKHYSNVIIKAASGGDYKANYHQLNP